MVKQRLFFILIILCVNLGCSRKTHHRSTIATSAPEVSLNNASNIVHHVTHENIKQQKHSLTIFIHGATTFVPSWNAFWYAWHTSCDDSSQSFYQHYQERARFSGYRCNQPIGIKGFYKIDAQCPGKDATYYSKHAFIIAEWYKQVNQLIGDTHHETNHSFYTFGWNGSLCHKSRKTWGHIFYQALVQEVQRIRTKQPNALIEITIVAHSHGGNVSLNLADAEIEHQKNLVIDNLVLLGTPIQAETVSYITSPIFKNIYNIYSTGDWVQKMDIISTDARQSLRTFGPRKHNDKCGGIPANVREIEIKIGSYKPGHAELWFAGGILHFFYRNNFPLYPFPVSVFVPCIKKIIDQTPCNNQVRIDIKRTTDNTYRFNLFDKRTRAMIPQTFCATLPLTLKPHKSSSASS